MNHWKIPDHLKFSTILSGIWTKVHRDGSNWIWIFDGKGRTGKSWACLTCAWNLDTNSVGERLFDPEKNICFSYKDLVRRINEVTRRGTVLIWEEAGSFEGANSRDYQSKINRALAKLVQIVGIKGIILLINLPSFNALDKQIRMICHSKTTMVSANADTGIGTGSFLLVSPHKYKFDIFESFTVNKHGKFLDFTRSVGYPRPPKWIVETYLRIEREFKNKWFGQVANDLNGKPISDLKKKLNKQQMVREFLARRGHEFWDEKKQRIDTSRMAWDWEIKKIDISVDTLIRISAGFNPYSETKSQKDATYT